MIFLIILVIIILYSVKNEYRGIDIKPVDNSNDEKHNFMDSNLKEMWTSNKGINEDYIGQIVFDSNLLNLPVVQAKSVLRSNGDLYRFYTEDGKLVEETEGFTGNDVYIWTSWKTGEYDHLGNDGSAFMDYRNNMDDQNIIVYGHHFARDFDPSGAKIFTPLDILLDQDNYEDNKYLSLILNDEIRRYVIANVFIIDAVDDYETQIVRTDMNKDFSGIADEGFFDEYIKYMNQNSEYDTGEPLKNDDRILTLITCVQHQPQYRQIVVCKEISDEIFDPS